MNKNIQKKLNIDYILKNYFYLIILVLMPLILIIGFLYLILPNFDSMKSELGTAIYLEQKYSELKTSQIEKLKSYKDTFYKIDKKNLDKMNKILPTYRDVTHIISEMNEITKKVDLSIDKISFEEEEESNKNNIGEIKQINFSLDIKNGGDYKKFKKLLSEIENNIRLFNVNSFYIKSDFSMYTLNISCYYKKI